MTLDDYLALDGPAPQLRHAYGTAAAQYAELFLPEGAGPFPLVALIHGGCWTVAYGGIRQMRNLAAALVAEGIAVWNIEYRCVDEAGGGYPGTYQDVALALDSLRQLAGAHALDLQRVVLVGHSAGGHLAQWAAARARLPRSSPLWVDEALAVPQVISLGGLADLRHEKDLIKTSCERDMVQLTGLPSAERPDVYADTSPGELLPAGVHTVLIHGELDSIAPLRVGQDFARRAQAAGDSAEVIVLPGGSHYDEVAASSPAWPLVLAAIRKALRVPD
ncbi:MAG: alpha/beta hydrolase [Sphingomonadaceae bacterium]